MLSSVNNKNFVNYFVSSSVNNSLCSTRTFGTLSNWSFGPTTPLNADGLPLDIFLHMIDFLQREDFLELSQANKKIFSCRFFHQNMQSINLTNAEKFNQFLALCEKMSQSSTNCLRQGDDFKKISVLSITVSSNLSLGEIQKIFKILKNVSSLEIEVHPQNIDKLALLLQAAQKLDLKKLEIKNSHHIVEEKFIDLPTELWNFKKLESLVLKNLPIKTLPVEIGNLNQLEELSLSMLDIDKLPTIIWQLEKMESMHLSALPIKSLPTEINNLPKLKNLKLYMLSMLEEIPKGLWLIPNVETYGLPKELEAEYQSQKLKK